LPTLVEFVIALGLVVIVASLFTDSVEILGARLEMAQEAVGNVLAAVGTALPETMIPIVAVLAIVFAVG
jgi:cation:H+ antiporter